MRKKTQLADLILGSGLVGDSSRRLQATDTPEGVGGGRPASAAGALKQQGPALYQFRGSASLRRSNSAVKAAAVAALKVHANGLDTASPEVCLAPRLAWEDAERSSCPVQTFNLELPEGSGVMATAIDWQAVRNRSDGFQQGVACKAAAVSLPNDNNSDAVTDQGYASFATNMSGGSLHADVAHSDCSMPDTQKQLQAHNDKGHEAGANMLAAKQPHLLHPTLSQTPTSTSYSHPTQPEQHTPGMETVSTLQSGRPTADGVRAGAARRARVEIDVACAGTQVFSRDQCTLPPASIQLKSSSMQKLEKTDVHGHSQQAAAASTLPQGTWPVEVLALQEQVKQLQLQLTSCEQRLQAAQEHASEAGNRWQDERQQTIAKQLKAIKLADAAQERAETGRRAAEQRAVVAQNEIAQLQAALSTKENVHNQAIQSLQLALESSQSAARTQAGVLEANVARLREELQAAHAANHTAVQEQKRAHEEAEEKLRQELARRTQTILCLSNDVDAFKQREKQLELQLVTLQAEQRQQGIATQACTIASSTSMGDLQQSTGTAVAQQSIGVPAGSKTGRTLSVSSQLPPRQNDPQQPPSNAQASSVSAHDHLHESTAPAPRGLSRQGSGTARSDSSRNDALDASKLAQLHQELKTQLAQVRQEYAQRLTISEDAVMTAKRAARDAANTYQQLFQTLVDRTALLLAGRLPLSKLHARGTTETPLTMLMSSTSLPAQLDHALEAAGAVTQQPAPLIQRPPTPAKRASVSAAAAGNDKLALLYAINDRLSSENAKLLAELARFHSGKHPMLRRASLTVVGAAEPAIPTGQGAAPGIAAPALLSSIKRSLSESGSAISAASQPPGTTTGKAATTRMSFTGSASAKSTSLGSTANGATDTCSQGDMHTGSSSHSTAVTAAKLALSTAVKEVLCCSRKQSLPAVLSGEGWQQQSKPGLDVPHAIMQCQLNSKAEAALSAAEQFIQSQAQQLALSQQCAALQQQVVAAVNQAAAEQEMHLEDKARAGQLAAQLAASQQQVAQLQEQLRSARYCTSPVDIQQHGSKDAQLTDQLGSARDEVQRHRNTAAAANRARDQLTQQLSDQQDSARRLETQLREVKYSLQQEQDNTKRLRALLTQARGLLKAAGVPFMDDDAGPHTPQPAAQEPVFKAVDARERHKEMQRLTAELAEWQHRAAAAGKELQAARAAHKRQEAAMQQAVTAAQAQAAEEGQAAKQLVAAVQAAREQAEQRASTSAVAASNMQRQVQDLSSELDKLRVHTQYLKQRTTMMKQQRSKLSYAPTLSISIEGSATVAASEQAPAGLV